MSVMLVSEDTLNNVCNLIIKTCNVDYTLHELFDLLLSMNLCVYNNKYAEDITLSDMDYKFVDFSDITSNKKYNILQMVYSFSTFIYQIEECYLDYEFTELYKLLVKLYNNDFVKLIEKYIDYNDLVVFDKSKTKNIYGILYD